MKKYLVGIFAILLAIGFSAFTSTKTQSEKFTNYYWYHTFTGVAFPGNPQAEPSIDCTTLGVGCAKGFLNPDSDPVHHTADATRKFN
jgi:hypothetical protein